MRWTHIELNFGVKVLFSWLSSKIIRQWSALPSASTLSCTACTLMTGEGDHYSTVWLVWMIVGPEICMAKFSVMVLARWIFCKKLWEKPAYKAVHTQYFQFFSSLSSSNGFTSRSPFMPQEMVEFAGGWLVITMQNDLLFSALIYVLYLTTTDCLIG